MSDNNNNLCPLCGKETQDSEPFCRDCQDIARDSFSEELLAHEESSVAPTGEVVEERIAEEAEESSADEPETESAMNKSAESFSRRNKKSLIFLGVGIFLLILTGVVRSYFFFQNRNAEETEIAYWNQCIESNTPLDYSKYLVQYSDGKFSEDAYRKIVELRENERNAWDKLRKANDIDALFAFLVDHPETPYIRDIRYAIDSLSWIKAQQENTAEAYLAYIENVKQGRFSGDYEELAQDKYHYISQLKTLEGEELNEVKKIVKDFFKALSSNNSKEVQKLSMDTLSKFYISEQLLSKDIVDSLKVNQKRDKVRNTLYTPVTDSINAIVDNKGICFITLPVKEDITYTDKKKKKDLLQSTLTIELNRKRLQAIFPVNSKQ
jgi:flagellar basal body-associated protein FliL